jgi:hypothetical protein
MLATRQDVDWGRAKEVVLLYIPTSPLEQPVSRRCQAQHVRHLRPGDERETRRSMQAKKILQPLADHLFDDRFGRAADVNCGILVPCGCQPVRRHRYRQRAADSPPEKAAAGAVKNPALGGRARR